MTARLIATDGTAMHLDVERWMAEPSRAERAVLDRTTGPVLDVGCGPGRHVLALARTGRLALGIDASPSAVDLARSRGAPVLLRSIFERVPGAGRWGSALLLDGNIGIGGDPPLLLSRIACLLRSAGRVLMEVEVPGAPSRMLTARLETSEGIGLDFPWAVVGADDAPDLARRSGFSVRELWSEEGRWFAELVSR